MSLHVLSTGDGYTYYTSEVATGDVRRAQGREIGDYYTVEGNPPGQWVGGGIGLLGMAGEVTEAQMKALFGEGLHPDAEAMIAASMEAGKSFADAEKEARLGRAPHRMSASSTKLAAAIKEAEDRFERTRHREPDAKERAQLRTAVGAQAFREANGRAAADGEELGKFITAATRSDRNTVSGIDLTFSPPKSVSIAWAAAIAQDDHATARLIEQAQERAIADSIAWLEENAIATRAGVNGVRQLDVEGGLIATKFRHHDSRSGDPQLHDHVVVANRVLGSDGKWRTLDSKLLHRQAMTAAAIHNRAVMDYVCELTGATTRARTVRAGDPPVVELAGVSDDLIAESSTRSRDSRRVAADLERDYRRDHGRSPDRATRRKIAQQAVLATRPKKEHIRPVAVVATAWFDAARKSTRRQDLEVGALLGRGLGSDQEAPFDPEDAARTILAKVSEARSTWGVNNVQIAAEQWVNEHRGMPGLDSKTGAAIITKTVIDGHSIRLTPPPAHGTFQPVAMRDGSSPYVSKGAVVFSSQAVFDAERIILDAAKDRTLGPVQPVTFAAAKAKHGSHLDAGQAALAAAFACDPVRVMVGVGPAGTGKTTALKVAARAIEAEGGRMIGLTPSAAAAAVMSDAVGIKAVTLDKFLVGTTLEQLLEAKSITGDIDLRRGDVIVVDEAGMAGTVNLAKVVRIAELTGAHVRFIGDDKQLDAVASGGMLRLLEHEVGATHLDELHRFSNPDEAAATLLLRDPTVKDPWAWHLANDRVVGGDADRMADHIFNGWQQDIDQGLDALMAAPTRTQVAELNARAQAYRFTTGEVSGRRGADLMDGFQAHVGDRLVTRKNDYKQRMHRGREFVKNGDRWTVERVHEDGSLDVVHAGHGGKLRLPADYVKQHAQLGYARTTHGEQGNTGDTMWQMVDASTSRNAAYVGGTRGRHRNTFVVITEPGQDMRDVLARIAGNVDPNLTAHEQLRVAQQEAGQVTRLADEYADLLQQLDDRRFAVAADTALGRDAAAAITAEPTWAVTKAALRQAEAAGLEPADVLYRAWTDKPLEQVENVPAALAGRVKDATAAWIAEHPTVDVPDVPAWIADPRPLRAAGVDDDWRTELQDRYDHIHARLLERGHQVAAKQPAWAAQLGAVPEDPARREAWVRLAGEVDTFRTRYNVDAEAADAVPAGLRERPVGQDLHARIVAAHKSSVLREQAADRKESSIDRLRARRGGTRPDSAGGDVFDRLKARRQQDTDRAVTKEPPVTGDPTQRGPRQ
ncbi:MobF family relaxase (plasmid) [Curtobacterium sp. MCLR17_007]|uniref:MobF family relaxase n=1 Tax=Curtobacterium sp. MCLR17_007 TaxID=2175648 RepID=UPI0011B569ED|nr:MobF family relaxase [Curtobacterium sp. MCLR17_007]WIB62069.1 MobF family relaxase [Curtobacterium sp. MCLR17_007]